MSGADQPLIWIRFSRLTEGHYVKWWNLVRGLTLLQSWNFRQNYQTFCEHLSTMWRVEIWFPEIRENGTALLSVNLTRHDCLAVLMEASFWVDICDANEKAISPKQSFTKYGIIPGDSIQETVEIKLPSRTAVPVQQDVIIFVSLAVCFCHVDNDLYFVRD